MQPSTGDSVSPGHLLPYEAQTSQHISKQITATETFAEETFYNHKPGNNLSFKIYSDLKVLRTSVGGSMFADEAKKMNELNNVLGDS
jgi:hypothetical protein